MHWIQLTQGYNKEGDLQTMQWNFEFHNVGAFFEYLKKSSRSILPQGLSKLWLQKHRTLERHIESDQYSVQRVSLKENTL